VLMALETWAGGDNHRGSVCGFHRAGHDVARQGAACHHELVKKKNVVICGALLVMRTKTALRPSVFPPPGCKDFSPSEF
jgi:hypothetical protein